MKPLKIARFEMDTNLGYLIQQVSGEPTEEILGHILGIATFAADERLKKTKARNLNIDIVLFYKETPIPFRVRVHSYNIRNPMNPLVHASVDVGFPSSDSNVDVRNLMADLTEVGLGLRAEGSHVPKFERPVLKTPKSLKNLRISQNESRD